MTTLPAAGRGRKRAPVWPLADDVAMATRLRMAREKAEDLRLLAEDGDAQPRERARLDREHVRAVELVAVLEERVAQQRNAETGLWRELWRTPQAVIWEQLGWPREVAQYVRWKVRAEQGDLEAGKEARQWSDRLGLNPLALLRLRWEIERTDEAETRGRRRRQTPPASPPAGDDPRAVLSAVS